MFFQRQFSWGRVLLQGMQHLKRQEHAAAEAKIALKPHFKNGRINKEEYKFILKRSVMKVSYLIAQWLWLSTLLAILTIYVGLEM